MEGAEPSSLLRAEGEESARGALKVHVGKGIAFKRENRGRTIISEEVGGHGQLERTDADGIDLLMRFEELRLSI